MLRENVNTSKAGHEESEQDRGTSAGIAGQVLPKSGWLTPMYSTCVAMTTQDFAPFGVDIGGLLL